MYVQILKAKQNLDVGRSEAHYWISIQSLKHPCRTATCYLFTVHKDSYTATRIYTKFVCARVSFLTRVCEQWWTFSCWLVEWIIVLNKNTRVKYWACPDFWTASFLRRIRTFWWFLISDSKNSEHFDSMLRKFPNFEEPISLTKSAPFGYLNQKYSRNFTGVL